MVVDNMAYATKSLFLVVIVFVASNYVNGDSQVPCYFIFGDSLADNGNNNQLKTSAKVNYGPYGIDYPAGPTGRFTNGRTGVDFIAEQLGFTRAIPPFASASGQSILQGVNYASGSAGIRDETGTNLGQNICLNKQLQNHQTTIGSLAKLIGGAAATSLLNKCLYTVGMGSNDYINNYFMPQHFRTKGQYTPEQYAGVLIDQYSKQLTSLYNAGARKIALIGLGPIGCTPYAIATHGKGGSCSDEINSAVLLFDAKFKSLVDNLNGQLSGAKFIYVNTFEISQGDPTAIGFKVLNKGCCPVGGTGLCNPGQAPCPNRNEYVFFDGFHPTEALNKYSAGRSFKAAKPDDAYPYDISTLVKQ